MDETTKRVRAALADAGEASFWPGPSDFTRQHYEVLTRGWSQVIGKVHPRDSAWLTNRVLPRGLVAVVHLWGQVVLLRAIPAKDMFGGRGDALYARGRNCALVAY